MTASPPSSRVNYVVEHAAPSAVCLVRKVQSSPYQPLPAEQVQSLTVPHLLSLRPPPHVAHQAVMDFYHAIHGHRGVHCPDPATMDLISIPAHPALAQGRNPPPLNEATMFSHAPQSQPGGSNGASLLNAPSGVSSSEDYRLSQIRRNERHVSNAVYGKVCAFFNTREGCRRGPYCSFLHVGRGNGGGNPAAGAPATPGAVLPNL